MWRLQHRLTALSSLTSDPRESSPQMSAQSNGNKYMRVQPSIPKSSLLLLQGNVLYAVIKFSRLVRGVRRPTPHPLQQEIFLKHCSRNSVLQQLEISFHHKLAPIFFCNSCPLPAIAFPSLYLFIYSPHGARRNKLRFPPHPPNWLSISKSWKKRMKGHHQ